MIINKNSGDGIREEVNEVFKGLCTHCFWEAWLLRGFFNVLAWYISMTYQRLKSTYQSIIVGIARGLAVMSAIMAASAVAPCIMTQRFQRKADLALCFTTNATFLAWSVNPGLEREKITDEFHVHSLTKMSCSSFCNSLRRASTSEQCVTTWISCYFHWPLLTEHFALIKVYYLGVCTSKAEWLNCSWG